MTKRLSRNEVVELIFRNMSDDPCPEDAEDILQALETNGILCLVDSHSVNNGTPVYHCKEGAE